MRKILITGSSGTVGTRLCEKLLEEGYRIVCTDFKENSWNKKIDKITTRVDLRDKKEVFDKFPSDINVIIHLAANARVPNSLKDPSLARDNLEINFNILELARVKGIKRFMFASSKDVYGNYKTDCSEGDVHIEACESPYAASKVGGEALVHAYHKCFGIDFLIFRISNVYGMYDEPGRLIPIFIRLTKEKKDLTVNGAGKLLDFIHIEDTADGIILCLKKFDKVRNSIFNIAYGEGTSLLKIAELVRKYLNGNNKILTRESKPGEVVRSISAISKAKKELGFFPRIDIEGGIERTIRWYEGGNDV